MEAGNSALAEFERIFGRKPRRTDPVFIGKYYLSDADLKRETLRAMRRAKISPSLIYAYQKTSRIVADPKLLTPGELREYNDAIDEFYDAVESGVAEASDLADPDTPQKTMHDQFRCIQIIIGYFIDKHFNKIIRRKNLDPAIVEREFFLGFAVTNFVRCLRSVLLLLDNDISVDALNLVRSLYENYLTVAYIYKRPEQVEIFRALLGTMIGSHGFGTSKSGTPIQSKIIDLSTKKEITIPSRWEIASSLGANDKELYTILYRPLSSLVHSEITSIEHTIGNDGFDYLNQDLTLEALLFSHLLALLLMDLLRDNSPSPRRLKEDLLLAMSRAILEIRLTHTYLKATKTGELSPLFGRILSTIASKNDLLSKIYRGTEPDAIIAETEKRHRLRRQAAKPT